MKSVSRQISWNVTCTIELFFLEVIFLQSNNGYAGGDSEVQLDEECAKVFAMDGGVSTVFDFRDKEANRTPNFNEKDFQRECHLNHQH